MEGYQPMDSFGTDVAESYDAELRGDELSTVTLLTELAGDGSALELAIGTGRIALPLAARGIRVDGVDMSAAMVSKLRAKPGGDDLSVTMGDFAEVPVDGTYQLIYLIFNTLFNLLTQDDQVRCFVNVARHLTDDGFFVVEAFVPTSLAGLDQSVDAERIEVDQVTFDVGRHDPVAQRLDESHVVISPTGIRLYPIATRYAWPSELDLMARIAGLKLVHRWGGWDREPFSATSRNHVSVYARRGLGAPQAGEPVL